MEELQYVEGNGARTTINRSFKKDALTDDPVDIQRREKVKEAMIHAWSSYEKYAWGQDELQVQRRILKWNSIQLLHIHMHNQIIVAYFI